MVACDWSIKLKEISYTFRKLSSVFWEKKTLVKAISFLFCVTHLWESMRGVLVGEEKKFVPLRFVPLAWLVWKSWILWNAYNVSFLCWASEEYISHGTSHENRNRQGLVSWDRWVAGTLGKVYSKNQFRSTWFAFIHTLVCKASIRPANEGDFFNSMILKNLSIFTMRT